jgi:hypothetical protein
MMEEFTKELPELTIITVDDYAIETADTGDVDVDEFGDLEMEEPETRTLNWERGLPLDGEDELGDMEMGEPDTRTLNWESRSHDQDELSVPESTWRVETHSEKAGNGEWFLPMRQKVFVVIGDTKPAAEQRSKGRTIRAATCSVCGKIRNSSQGSRAHDLRTQSGQESF